MSPRAGNDAQEPARPLARRVGDVAVARDRLAGALVWLGNSAATTSGLARERWSPWRGWGRESTIATARVLSACCAAVEARAGSVDGGRLADLGRALVTCQRRDGAFEPAHPDEDEEPATSAAVAALARLAALRSDTPVRVALQRGAARVLAARARPSAALALARAWAVTGDVRFHEAACDGRAAAITRLESRARAPLSVSHEAIVDLDLLWTVAEILADDFDLEPVASDVARRVVVRLEASAGALADGYGASDQVARPGVDHVALACAARVLLAMDTHRADPRARFAAALGLDLIADSARERHPLDGGRGAVGARTGRWAARDVEATAGYAEAVAALLAGRSVAPRAWSTVHDEAARATTEPARGVRP